MMASCGAPCRESVEDNQSQIKEAVDEIIAWHVAQQQKWGAEHREELAAKFGSAHGFYLELAFLARIGRKLPNDAPFSPVALEKWQRILADESPDSPFADWAKAWRALPQFRR